MQSESRTQEGVEAPSQDLDQADAYKLPLAGLCLRQPRALQRLFYPDASGLAGHLRRVHGRWELDGMRKTHTWTHVIDDVTYKSERYVDHRGMEATVKVFLFDKDGNRIIWPNETKLQPK